MHYKYLTGLIFIMQVLSTEETNISLITLSVFRNSQTNTISSFSFV